MAILVVGASGATGKQLVEQLLIMGQDVRVIVRPNSNIPDTWKSNPSLTIIKANVADISTQEMAGYTKDCDGFASCLGHNITMKGVFGKPRRLVTDAVKLLCSAIKENNSEKPVRFVLMNTVGNRNRDLNEPISLGHRIIIGLIRLLIPPLKDNEKAADFLRLNIGKNNPTIEWVAVRPDSLLDIDKVTDYELHPSPIRSAIFDPGKTSRINVGHFMAKLLLDSELWEQWKGQMPVIYNKS